MLNIFVEMMDIVIFSLSQNDFNANHIQIKILNIFDEL